MSEPHSVKMTSPFISRTQWVLLHKGLKNNDLVVDVEIVGFLAISEHCNILYSSFVHLIMAFRALF